MANTLRELSYHLYRDWYQKASLDITPGTQKAPEPKLPTLLKDTYKYPQYEKDARDIEELQALADEEVKITQEEEKKRLATTNIVSSQQQQQPFIQQPQQQTFNTIIPPMPSLTPQSIQQQPIQQQPSLQPQTIQQPVLQQQNSSSSTTITKLPSISSLTFPEQKKQQQQPLQMPQNSMQAPMMMGGNLPNRMPSMLAPNQMMYPPHLSMNPQQIQQQQFNRPFFGNQQQFSTQPQRISFGHPLMQPPGIMGIGGQRHPMMYGNPFSNQGQMLNYNNPMMQQNIGRHPIGGMMNQIKPIPQRAEGDLSFFDDYGTAQQSNMLASEALSLINANTAQSKDYEDVQEQEVKDIEFTAISEYSLDWLLDEGEKEEEF